MTLGFVLIAIMVVMLFARMPEGREPFIPASEPESEIAEIPCQARDEDRNEGKPLNSKPSTLNSITRLFRNRVYREGVIAQFFYVGAQIGVWSFTIRIVMQELGVVEAQAFSRARLIEEICKRNAKGQADTPRKRLAEQGACLPCELDDMAMLIGRTLQAAELDLPDETLCPQDYETWGILIEKASICHLHTLALGVDAVLPEKEVAFLHEDYVNRYAKLKKSE